VGGQINNPYGYPLSTLKHLGRAYSVRADDGSSCDPRHVGGIRCSLF
jgi:hypothetical protein